MSEPRQMDLSEAIAPCDPKVTAEEAPRLSRQSAAILGRLNAGPATNTELAGLALKYTGRISDLRAAGFRIEAFDRDHASGVCWYRLSSDD